MQSEGWTGKELAEAQLEAARDDLGAYRRGYVKKSWRTLRRIIGGLDTDDPLTLLDVGCGIGAAAEILSGTREIDYWGMDSNSDVIELARQEFPDRFFICHDIKDISVLRGFDLVMSNGTLNHIHAWQKALTNMAAMSECWLILHRLWVYHDMTPTSAVLCQTYARNLWHLRINEAEMVDLLAARGLGLKDKLSSDGEGAPQEGWTYLFERA